MKVYRLPDGSGIDLCEVTRFLRLTDLTVQIRFNDASAHWPVQADDFLAAFADAVEYANADHSVAGSLTRLFFPKVKSYGKEA